MLYLARRRLAAVAAAAASVAAPVPVVAEAATSCPTTAPSLATVDAPPPSSAAGADELGALVADFIGDQPGGASVFTVRDGVTMTAAVGVANACDEVITPTTPFRVGSIAKPFVATMVLQLVDAGTVDLDAELATYLPDTPVGGTATVRQLLGHRSGLPNYTASDQFLAAVLGDRERVIAPSEVLEWVDEEDGSTPGEFTYSNTNYLLLGQLVEVVDGRDLDAALQARISGPLGLEATRFVLDDPPGVAGLAAGWSTGILDGDDSAPYASFASSAWAAGALVSTTGDLAAFLDALFAGELLSDGRLAEMTATDPDGYGLGLFAVSFGPQQPAFGHNGAIVGFTSVMALDPVSSDALVVLTNNDELVAEELAASILAAWS